MQACAGVVQKGGGVEDATASVCSFSQGLPIQSCSASIEAQCCSSCAAQVLLFNKISAGCGVLGGLPHSCPLCI